MRDLAGISRCLDLLVKDKGACQRDGTWSLPIHIIFMKPVKLDTYYVCRMRARPSLMEKMMSTVGYIRPRSEDGQAALRSQDDDSLMWSEGCQSVDDNLTSPKSK